ncbi:MAG: hypothetical protein PHC66_01475 [Candidatus Nanoarchaeia archaeon]|nr:hypothetical protein [Candidatus Nanoarchaeia archaeon]MDD5239171.1 hypothetical protein [Candidatus Nanoarchaeia archaeon]
MSEKAHSLKSWKSRPSLDISTEIFKKKISVEEAALNTALNFIDELTDVDTLKNLFQGYEINKDSQKKKEILITPKTGEKIQMPTYPVKNKKNYELFIKFYKAAKKELKEKGTISEETINIIRKN